MKAFLSGLFLLSAALPGAELPDVKRIFVDRLSGGETAAQIRDMLIAALQSSGRFRITENRDKSDAVLKGSAEDLVYTDEFSSSDSLTARATTGSIRTDRSTTRTPGITVGQQESTRIAERKHEASASVHLVDAEGEVLWSTTQESGGAKFKSASADVADKVVRALLSRLSELTTQAGSK